MRLLLPLFALACSDYSIVGKKDPTLPGETGEPDTADTAVDDPDDGECGPPDLSTGEVVIDESCQAEAIVGTFTPVIEWASTAPGAAYTTPVVGQLTDDDGDGAITEADMPDIVVVGTGGLITVLSGDGAGVHWTYNMGGSEPSTAAIGDLDNDGFPEVVGTGSAGVFALHGDTGAVMWTSNTGALSSKAICGGVGIYDLDGDGKAEIVQGNVIYNGQTGAIRGVGGYGAGTGYSGGTYASFGVAADIDQDGDQEVVVGNALYDADGNTLWHNGQSDGFVAVADFDGDAEGEIVVAWSGNVRLQDDDGTVLWSGSYTGSTIGPPTVADFDGDGQPEIGVAGNGQYTVIETDGSTKWSKPTQDYSSGFTGSSVFDFEGDGAAEVVYADEVSVWVFDGATGATKMEETHHTSLTCSEYPAVADVDNDGHAEIIYSSYPYLGPETGVTVIGDADDTWMPGREIWNQHSYAITNVGNTGQIPAVPATNWASFNNFRSGDMTASTGGALTNAVPEPGDICTEECADGRLRVVVRMGNSGVETLPGGVYVSAYAKQATTWVWLSAHATTGDIASGQTSPGLVFDFDPADVPDGALRFVVDDYDGEEQIGECHEDDNVLEITSGLCP